MRKLARIKRAIRKCGIRKSAVQLRYYDEFTYKKASLVRLFFKNSFIKKLNFCIAVFQHKNYQY